MYVVKLDELIKLSTILKENDFSSAQDDLLNLIIAIANGKKTLNEEHGYEEIAIFKDGITL